MIVEESVREAVQFSSFRARVGCSVKNSPKPTRILRRGADPPRFSIFFYVEAYGQPYLIRVGSAPRCDIRVGLGEPLTNYPVQNLMRGVRLERTIRQANADFLRIQKTNRIHKKPFNCKQPVRADKTQRRFS